MGGTIDFDRPNPARMYDYLLGGRHNFVVDREQAEKVLIAFPGFDRVCRANREFLRRVVEHCLDAGIDQFLDLGSGVPTAGNVHEVAHRVNPRARVAYVDVEPVAVAHAREIVAGDPTVSVTRADLREPETVLTAPGVAGLLDFDRPVALLALTVVHYVPTDAAGILARYRRALAPGSVQAISHGTDDHEDPELGRLLRAVRDAYVGTATEVVLRTRPEIEELLAGTEPVGPAMVDLVDWPEPRPGVAPTGALAAVGRLPGPAPVGEPARA